MSNCNCGIVAKNNNESRVLVALLCINLFIFVAEIAFGIISESSALITD
jgi:Co/Zn/Cd efflux system component